MNPYQKIVKNGELVQKGHIDTFEKFKQLTDGVDLENKNVVDIGCNLGMMTKLASEAGAKYVLGIDQRADYIYQARELWPGLRFNVRRLDQLAGFWDVGILSAAFHYMDPKPALHQLAQHCDKVVMDVNLAPGHGLKMVEDHRGLWLPTKDAWEKLAHTSWELVFSKGPAISPDKSTREIFHLAAPKRKSPVGVLLHGPGGCGKTTRARDWASQDHMEHLQIDRVWLDWRMAHKGLIFSVDWHGKAVRGKVLDEYLDYYTKWISRWLDCHLGQDVILEGADLAFDDLRAKVQDMMESRGWSVQVVSWKRP